MGSVRRLLTFADLDDRDGRGHSISARLIAELVDESHVVLLDDRGWSSGHGGAAGHSPEEVEMTARMVVGPDEPWGDQTRAQVESDHWATLERKLKDAGVATDGADLRALPPGRRDQPPLASITQPVASDLSQPRAVRGTTAGGVR